MLKNFWNKATTFTNMLPATLPPTIYARAAKAPAPRIQATDEEAEAVLRAMEELGK